MAVAMSTMFAVKRNPRHQKTARQQPAILTLSPALVRDAQSLLSIYNRVDWEEINQAQSDTVHLYFQSEEAVHTANRIWLELAASLPDQRNDIIRKIKNAFQNIGLSFDKKSPGGQSANRVNILLADLSTTQDPCHFAELCLEAALLHEETCAEVRILLRQTSAREKKLLPPPLTASPFWLGSAADLWMSVPLWLALTEPIIGLCRRITGVNTGAATLLLEPDEEHSLRQIQRLFNECQPQSYRISADAWSHPYGRELQKILDAFVPELRKFIGDWPDQGQAAEPAARNPSLLAITEAQAKPSNRTAPEAGRKTVKIKEAAEMLGVCENTVRNLITRGKLRRVPGIRHVVIPLSEIDRFLSEKTN